MKNKIVVGTSLAFMLAVAGPFAMGDMTSPPNEPKAAPATMAPHQWIPVEQDVWAVFLEAPEYHFAKAREAATNKDNRTAAAEIREGAKLLRFQAKRLNAAVSDLDGLAKQVSNGKATGDQMDKVLVSASKTLDYKEPMVPFAEGEDQLFVESGGYHVKQAKTKLAAKDKSGAAVEIRKAIAFLKIEAAHTGHDITGDLKSALDDMEALAKKVESGTDIAAKDLDQAFARARKSLTSKK